MSHIESARKAYPSDLTDTQWQLIEPFVRVDIDNHGPKPVLYERREIVNAILYQTRTGCQWRYLPHDLPSWRSVFYYFQLWQKDGTLKKMHDSFREKVRIAAGRNAEPSAGVLDSQSAKSTEEAETRGYDAGKKVKGRKRHLIVDVIGLLLVVWVSTADVQDRDAAKVVFPRAAKEFSSLKLVWADGGYQGPIAAAQARAANLTLEIVKRSDDTKGFKVLPRRWVVERTFGWLNRERRLSKDYERTEESATAFIYWGMTRLMARRLG